MNAVVTDLDGTLLRSDRTISQRTLDIINSLGDRGIKFIIATARAPRDVLKLFPFKMIYTHVICYNGAEIYAGDTLIYHKYIEPVEVTTIVEWLHDNLPGANIALEMDNQLFTNFDIRMTKGWYPPYTQIDLRSFVYKPAAKILVDLSYINDRKALIDVLPRSCSMLVTDGGTLAQIANSEISKANGVKSLAKILGLSLKDIVAFGDDFNDIDMIRECGIGVAMGNSPHAVKEAANIVAATNDEDGVAVELEKMILMMEKNTTITQG